jgi:hypothetical protein
MSMVHFRAAVSQPLYRALNRLILGKYDLIWQIFSKVQTDEISFSKVILKQGSLGLEKKWTFEKNVNLKFKV